MIAKVILTGKSFGETCNYLCQEQSASQEQSLAPVQSRGQVLDSEGVRSHDLRLMAADFEWQHGLMPEKEKPVFHSVLSFPPGERPTDERLVELGRRYLEEIEMLNTQYALVKHTDKEHLHVHVLANRVNNDGEPIGKGLIVERSIKAAKALTEEYGLEQNESKRLERTHLDALHEPDVKRYRIYQAIGEELPQCEGLDDLEKGLLKRGITVRYHRDQETGERQGISFRLENRSFKGSRVDEEYGLKKLERTLGLQQELRQKPELFEGKEFGERLRLMRNEELRREEELRVEGVRQEGLRQKELLQQEVLQKELLRQQELRQTEELHVRQHRGLRQGM